MKQISVALGFAILAVALWALGDEATELLAYQRDAILQGQWWRLVTAHWIHLSGQHLAMNLGALAVVWLLFGKSLTSWIWLFVAGCSALGSTLSLLFLHPEVDWYVGLSGLLHGLLVAAAMLSLRSTPSLAWLVLAFICAKLIAEASSGTGLLIEAFIGGPVLTIAHLYGAGWGGVAAVTLWIGRIWSSGRQAGAR